MKFRFQKINGKADVNWDLINTYISRWKDGSWFDAAADNVYIDDPKEG